MLDFAVDFAESAACSASRLSSRKGPVAALFEPSFVFSAKNTFPPLAGSPMRREIQSLDHRGVFVFGGFLGKGVAIFKVNHVAKGRGGNVVQERGQSHFFVACPVPHNQRAVEGMVVARIIKVVVEERRPIRSAQKADAL